MIIGESRARLHEADRLLREQRHAEAVAIYESVAQDYADRGFAIKAISVTRRIIEIADQCAPKLQAARSVALKRLVSLQRDLGLVS